MNTVNSTVELVIDLLLLTHVAAGVVALVTAFVAIGTRKGVKAHRRIGQVYFWAMLLVGVTAIPVTFVRPNPFLFFIALFSFYMAYAGYRRGRSGHVDQPSDVLAAWLMVGFALVMVGYGVFMLTQDQPLGWALIAFGGLGGTFGIEDIAAARQRPTHSAKVRVHLSRMLGGTIATITAVLVQQVTPLVTTPIAEVALWLGPTIVLTPVIFFWNWRIAVTGKYRLFAPRAGVATSA